MQQPTKRRFSHQLNWLNSCNTKQTKNLLRNSKQTLLLVDTTNALCRPEASEPSSSPSMTSSTKGMNTTSVKATDTNSWPSLIAGVPTSSMAATATTRPCFWSAYNNDDTARKDIQPHRPLGGDTQKGASINFITCEMSTQDPESIPGMRAPFSHVFSATTVRARIL